MSEEDQKEIPKPQTEGITRRSFLKRTRALMAIPFLPKLPDFQLGSPKLEEDQSFEARVAKLMSRVGENAEVATFLEASLKASENLEILAQRPEVDQIRHLVRKQFNNPDIDVDEQIFFLRDRKILNQALDKLEHLKWETDELLVTSQQANQILESAPFSVTPRENAASPTERRLTPKVIVENYEKMGTRKSPGKIEIEINTQGTDPKSKERENQLKKLISEVLGTLPLGDTQVWALSWQEGWNDWEPVKGTYSYLPREKTGSVIEYHFQTTPSVDSSEKERLLVMHEASHSMDITLNPNLIQFLSADDIIELTLLREEAEATETAKSLPASFSRKRLRGGRISPFTGDVEIDQHFLKDYRNWFIEQSKKSPITSDEFEIYASIYPVIDWVWFYPLLKPWYETFQIEIQNVLNQDADPAPINSWQEFMERSQKAIYRLWQEDDFFKLGFDLLKGRIDKVENDFLLGQPAINWQSQFAKAVEAEVAENMLQSNGSKNIMDGALYNQLVADLILEYRVAGQEGFADAVSSLLFLQTQRNQNPADLDSPYWAYFEKLRSAIPV